MIPTGLPWCPLCRPTCFIPWSREAPLIRFQGRLSLRSLKAPSQAIHQVDVFCLFLAQGGTHGSRQNACIDRQASVYRNTALEAAPLKAPGPLGRALGGPLLINWFSLVCYYYRLFP